MRIYPTEPKFESQYASDLSEYLTRGVNPHDPFPGGLVRSSYWVVYADEKEIIVYDTPVTHAGPHCFTILPKGTKSIRAVYHSTIRKAVVLPERAGIIPKVKDREICFVVGDSHNLLIEINGTNGKPLSLFRENHTALPNPEEENVLWYEPGIHRIRNIELKSNQTVYLSPGAILIPEQPDDKDLILDANDWAGKVCYQDFIFAKDQKNIKICGSGIIDMTSLDWHARRTIVFTSCENVEVTGIVMIGACSWTMPFFGCKNVHVDGIRMLAYRENSDGIDLVDTHIALIENCFIRTGDDAICLKSMSQTPRIETHDVLVRNCCVWNDKVRAFGIAGETRHNIYHAVFEHCDVIHSLADWTTEVCALGVYICDAAEVYDITFRDIVIRQESNHVVCCCIVKDKWSSDEGAGHIHDIRFENISFPEDFTVYLSGYDENHKLKNIGFENCTVSSKKEIIEIEEFIDTKRFVEI